MSTYLPNSNDYIPELQPFNPDLNFYAGVLSTKQSQYDQGLSKLSSIYSSAFNSPMLRIDNIERRDRYFKTIEQNIQKVAGMDLSIDQNVSSAKTLFDPILNDQHIVKDMVYTKGIQNSYQKAEQFRNCVDPDKCGGEYWEEGVQALEFAKEEFQKASADDSLKYTAPEYTPFQNVTRKAIKAAKDSGFNVSYDYKSADGRYNVTDTNGQLLLGPDGQGVLPQYLYGLFGNDSSVQKMYSTQAYVQRKNYAKSNAGRFNGSEDQAESEYLQNVMLQSVPKIEKAKADLTQLRDKVTVDTKALEILAKENPSDEVQQAYAQLQNILTSTDSTVAYHDQVSNLIATAPNLNDLRSLRSRVDNVVANANFMGAINAAATEYAMGTSKHELKADPYALASYNASLDISKGKALKDYDFLIWQEQEKIKGTAKQKEIASNLGIPSGQTQDMNNYLKSQGVTAEKLAQEGLPPNVNSWTEADFKKAREGGLNQEVVGKIKEVRDMIGGESTEDAYTENSKLFVQSVNNLTNSSVNYLKDSFDNMREQFLNPVGATEEEKTTVRNKILNNMNTILEGTGVTASAIINGTTTTEVFAKTPTKFSRSVGRAVTLQEKDVASQVVTGQWSPKALAKYQVDKQVAEGFYAGKKAENQKVMDNMRADLEKEFTLEGTELSIPSAAGMVPIKGTTDPEKLKQVSDKYHKQRALIESIANEDGLLTKEQALSRYVKETKNLYFDDAVADLNKLRVVVAAGALLGVGTQRAEEKAREEFDENYDKIQEKYRNSTNSFKAKAGASDRGGVMASGKEMVFSVRGEQKFSPAFNQIEKIAKEIPDVTGADYYASTATSLTDKEPLSVVKGRADQFFEKIKTGDTQGIDFTYDLRNMPTSLTSGQLISGGALLKVNMSDESARKIYGLDKDVDVTPYKSFSVKVPSNTSPAVDAFIQKTTPSNVDIYMLQDKATLNQNLPNLGSYNITRQGENMIFSGQYKGFNPLTGKDEDIPFESTNLGNISPEKAIELGNSLLSQAGAFTKNAKQQILNPTQ